MESYDPEELINQVENEQQETSDLASKAVQWFLDEQRIGQFYPRDEVIDELSDHLDVTVGKSTAALTSVVGDIVDPVQQIIAGGTEYIGIVEYNIYSDEGAYGYTHIDDVLGEQNRVVCARCVEKETLDANVTHATQGEGTSDHDATWNQLLNKITSHYADAHTKAPEDIEPGASLLDGTTISGNVSLHFGNTHGDGEHEYTLQINGTTVDSSDTINFQV